MKKQTKILTATIELPLHEFDCEMSAICALEMIMRSIKGNMRKEMFEYFKEVCPRCKGLGYIKKKPCPVCKGYGLGKGWGKIT